MGYEVEAVALSWEEGANIIVGQSHFIKTAEDLAEIIAGSVPGAQYGLAFCEASGPCLIRTEGNDEKLVAQAVECARKVGAGHSFFLVLRKAFPINVLNQIKDCPEVARIFCATSNPLEVLVVQTAQGRGIVGVVDGFPPRAWRGRRTRRNAGSCCAASDTSWAEPGSAASCSQLRGLPSPLFRRRLSVDWLRPSILAASDWLPCERFSASSIRKASTSRSVGKGSPKANRRVPSGPRSPCSPCGGA